MIGLTKLMNTNNADVSNTDQWYAISVQYVDSCMAIHTLGAPNRPKGIS